MDPVITGAAAKVSSEVAKGIFQEIKRHMRYVIIYKQNIDKFEEKLKSLIAKRTSVQQEVAVADNNGEKIKADVEHWCNTVDKVINEEEKKVKDLEDKAKNKCFVGLCPNIKSRYQLSKQANKGAVVVDNLIQLGQFNGVGYIDVPKAIVGASPNGFETFKSREKVFNDIMEATKDATVSMIGVYGMPGVGKTLLVKEVARQVQEVKLFDSVVAVTVAQTPDIQKIQENIAELLGLRLEDKSTDVRARRLHERLKKEKTVLVVLDDIWKRLDLEEVGIPFGNKHKGCKILLTSRDQHVLSNGMDADKTFAIDDLDDQEAWDLFRKMAGAESIESAELRSTAIEVAKKCARLPLAIATVAKALRNKSLFAWKDALRQLQKPSSRNFTGISADVYSAIELSYNHLENEELKQVFLLCGLVRRDTSIDDLLKYTIGLSLIKGVDTMEEARNRLLTMVSDLKASCLLLDSNTSYRYFDMHDLVYDVAMSIASKDNHVFAFNKEDVLKDWPDEETMKKCDKIHLGFASIRELPDELNCPQLVYFHVFSKDGSLIMPPNFFKETTNLKVLHLTRVYFSLSSSICHLTSLRTLCLYACALADIAVTGELKNLEILSFSNSYIEILPKEIGRLVKLKLLDLSHCTKLEIISPDVLSSLIRLEELYMYGTFIQWEVGGHANHRTNASLAELTTLSCLTTLEVHIPDAEAVLGGLFFKELQKLERYKIFIGKEWEWEWFGAYEYSRTLGLKLSTSVDHLAHGIKILLKKIEALYLDELKGVKIAIQELEDEESLSHLKYLCIQNGSVIKYIINDNGIQFPQLRSLTLQNLPQLISFCFEDKSDSTSISQHELPLFNEKMLFPCLENLQLSSINVEKIWHNSFYNHENLTTLIVQDCGNLKHFLSFSIARKLVHLKYLEIIGCMCLREIISTEDIEEEESKTIILFPQLNSLELRDLQHLIGFCSKCQNIEFPSLKSLKIINCPELKGFIYKSTKEGSQHFSRQALFNEKVLFSCLENLQLCSINVERIWHNELSISSFYNHENLTNLVIKDCGNLKHLLSFSMARRLVHLEYLEIIGCKCLREIISTEDIEEESKAKILFPQLNSLELRNIELSSLKSLNIDSCPELRGFICKSTMEGSQCCSSESLFDKKVAFPNLEGIFISNLRSINMIWQNQVPVNSFRKLQRMEVVNCDYLLTIFPSDTLRALQGLQTLRVERCVFLEEIFEVEGSSVEEARAVTTQLRELFIKNLPNLKYIWKNDPQGFFTFENLQVIHVWCCLNLKNVFPASIARVLPQLRDLCIDDCGVEEIVSKEEGLKTAVTFEFNQVSSLKLWNLPQLKCFYPGVHTTKWPMLKQLKAYKCGKTKIFGTECFSIVNTPNVLIHPSLFLAEKQAWSLDDLPTTVALTMHQGSTVTSMDFHPSQHTLLLVGSANAEITLWELGMRKRFITKSFKIWDMAACSMTFQGLMVNDTPISVKRVTWSPDGSFVGVSFSKHLIHLYAYPGSNDLIQHLEIDAHVGGVNDLAFAHPNKQLYIVTCGDDKLIKVWDSMTGQKLFNFEGHDAPVYSICPHQKQSIPLIYSTAVDGTIILWLYNDLQFRADFVALGHGSTTMLYSADGSRLFTCGTSKDGQSYLAEWYKSQRVVKRIYTGFGKKSAGVVSFDTTQNQFLAAGEDSQIKFWHMDNSKLLTFTDAEGGLPSLPRVRFNKEGNLLAVTIADNGFKILANDVGLRSLKVVDDAIEKTKPWQLAEIVDPLQCRLVNLPDSTDTSSKVVRLLYTNSGFGILALGSNGVQKLWKWPRNEQNPSGEATANVVPQHWQPNSGLLMTNDVSGVNLEEAVPCITLSKNDLYVMSATGGKVSLFNMMTFKVMATFLPPPPASTFLAFHPQNKNIIAIGMDDSSIYIYNVQVDKMKSKLRGHQKRITGLAFSTSLNILVSSGADAHLCVWSIFTWVKRKSVAMQIPAGKAPTGDTRIQFQSDQIRLLVVHETQLAIYDASKMERIRQWIPEDVLPAPISYATYSCNNQSVYATFLDGNVGVFEADSLRLRCRIASSVYLSQAILKGKQAVYPLVVAAHPMEANQFAIGLSDGSVKVMEPTESEGKWGVSQTVDSGVVNGSTTSSSTTGNHIPDQLQR